MPVLTLEKINLTTIAREMLKNQGGGELITKDTDGKIRSKDTIAPENDPNPPKDTEN